MLGGVEKLGDLGWVQGLDPEQVAGTEGHGQGSGMLRAPYRAGAGAA